MTFSKNKKYNKIYWKYTNSYKELDTALKDIKNIIYSEEDTKLLRKSINYSYDKSIYIPYIGFIYKLYGDKEGTNKVLNKNRFESVHYENAIKYIFKIYADLSRKQVKYNILSEEEINTAIKRLVKTIGMYIECFESTEKISAGYINLLITALDSIADMKNYFDGRIKERYNREVLNMTPIFSKKEDLDIKWK